jgi:hypothetical protein
MSHFTGDTSSKIKAIETNYNGYRFRSRLEARWAVFFDSLGVKYSYEPEGFNLGALGCYLPDFYLQDEKLWIEIKPFLEPFKRIYLAGKIAPNDWRTDISSEIADASFLEDSEIQIPEYPMVCTGPFFIAYGHGMAHGRNTHGVASDDGITQKNVTTKSFGGIDRAQTVFVWINDLTCYGTLIECGYASARRKDIRVGISNAIKQKILLEDNQHFQDFGSIGKHDLWFLETISTACVFSDSAREAFDFLYGYDTLDSINKLKVVAYNKKEHYSTIFGDPSHYQECGSAELFKTLRKNNIEWDLGIVKSKQARFEHGEHP